MFDQMTSTVDIRLLERPDADAVAEHFLRLDAEGRRSRFNGAISDEAVLTYAHDLVCSDSLIWGAFVRGILRAIGEVRGLFNGWAKGACVDVAISVEPAFQHHGLGSGLFRRILKFARRYGLRNLCLTFQRSNEAMYHMVQKYNAKICADHDDYQALIRLEPSSATRRIADWYRSAPVFNKA